MACVRLWHFRRDKNFITNCLKDSYEIYNKTECFGNKIYGKVH